MNKILESGKTLLVDGPATVTVISGKASIFGFQVFSPFKATIREGKRLPFTALEPTQLCILLGLKAFIKETDGSTIPASWVNAAEKVQKIQERPTTIMTIGGVDSGKTSFCTYLANSLTSQGYRVVILDEDLGQSDIGPPGTLAYAYVSTPIIDMFDLKEQNAIFLGITSPTEALNRTVEAASVLKEEALSSNKVDFIIVNTDGWVIGEDAAKFKIQLARVLEVDIVFCLQNKEDSLCIMFKTYLPQCSQEIAESPFAVSQRNWEKRKVLRELNYVKYLKNAKSKIIFLHNIIISGNKEAIYRRYAQNLLIGIYGAHGKFLGIGIIEYVDYNRMLLKIFTPVTEKPKRVVLGKVRLTKNFKEISSDEPNHRLPIKEASNLFGK
jgi:polynucleotide 5'-hydroxyl-kinase GRC3/NOL9